MKRPARLASIACAAGLLLCAAAPIARGVTPDYQDEALRKMCEEGLANAATRYCRAQVEHYSEQAPLRARWAMRQMECLCQAALLESAESDAAWQTVVQFEEEYRRQFPSDPRLPWLAWQLARGDLLRAQQGLAKWLSTPAATPQREAALQAVRRALQRLDDVEADVQKRLPLSEPRSATAKTQAPSSELLALSVDCTLLRCEALLVRSRAYPPGSSDRAAAAADVDRIAGEMLLRAPQDWPARDELLVARATAGLEAGKRDESLEMLLSILNERPVEAAANTDVVTADAAGPPVLPSPRARLRAGSAVVEALCGDGDVAAAEQALQTLTANFTGPEVELNRIRVMLARLDKLDAAQRTEQFKTIIAQAADLGKKYGGYWRNRADALLVGSSTSKQASADGDHHLDDLVTVEVRQLLAGGQTTAAIAKLRTASQNAQASGNGEAALQFAMQAAALLQRDKDWLAAADTLIPAADANPDVETAPAAYALAAWSLAQALQAQSSKTQPQKAQPQKSQPRDADLALRYERTLQTQLERWPEAPESLKAEEYLANWLTRKKRFNDLASMWAERAASAQQSETKSRALKAWLDTLLGKVPLPQVSAQQAGVVSAVRDGKFAACQPTAAVVALAAAMLTEPLTQAEAEAMTGLKLPSHAAEESLEDGALLAAVRALAAARRGDATACRSALGLLASEQLSKVVALAWGKAMVEAMDELSASQVPLWASVAEQIAWSDEADAPSAPALEVVGLRLRMIRHPGSPDAGAALEEIRQLADTHARDPQLQLVYAAALAQSDAKRFDEAVRILKRVALGTSKNSESYLRSRWLEIRWRVARGESQAAAQIASLALTSHEIEPPWWKARFEAAAK
ncbi:MAG: hypothetical protein ACTHK7_12560 [Aureliella sp.]